MGGRVAVARVGGILLALQGWAGEGRGVNGAGLQRWPSGGGSSRRRRAAAAAAGSSHESWGSTMGSCSITAGWSEGCSPSFCCARWTRSGASLHAGWWSRHCSAIATSASKNRKRPFGQQGLATSPAGSRELSYLAIWFDTCARRRQCTFSTMWRRWRQRFGGGRRTACHVTDGATHRRATAIEDEECLIGALK